MVKVASFHRVPAEGKKLSKAFFRSRVHVTCDFEFPQDLGRIAVIKRIRKVLQANAELMGLDPETRFFFSKNRSEEHTSELQSH